MLLEHDAVQLHNVRMYQLPQCAELALRARDQVPALLKLGAYQADSLKGKRCAIELYCMNGAKGATAEQLSDGEACEWNLQILRVRPCLQLSRVRTGWGQGGMAC